MSKQFNNMIQILTYFAEQCEIFTPVLEGVKELNRKNETLEAKMRATQILQNRMQLNTTYSADTANFGIEMVKAASTTFDGKTGKILPENEINDLYILIKSVISIGKHNYDRLSMEELLDFYVMLDKITFDQFIELFDLIDQQHYVEPPVIDPPAEPT